jgi:hypothetical protein
VSAREVVDPRFTVTHAGKKKKTNMSCVGVHTGSCEFTGHKYPVRTRNLVIKDKMMDSLEAHVPLDVKEIGI